LYQKKKRFSNHLKIHCEYLEIETIVSCLFFNHTNEYKVMNNYIVQENLIFSNLDDVNNFLAICMRYFDVWNKHQYWMDIIYMERFLFLVSFSFWSLKIWQVLYFFLSHFGFKFFMKGVLLGCLMGVHVDKKIIQSF